MADSDPIKHVVVLALENRSFDHMLGACRQGKPAIDGIDPNAAPRTNLYEGKPYPQIASASRIVVEDPRHETAHVLAQIRPGADGTPGGFVQDYATAYPMLTDDGRGEVMKYHAVGALPALHALAQNFLVCDRWFSSVPGPTWANRLFMMSGTSLGRVAMPNGVMDLNLHWYDQPTIFDRLNERHRSWRVYHGDTPLSLLLAHQWEKRNAEGYQRLSCFSSDASCKPGDFPDFVFIEPAYLDPGANDDHPSHDVLAGEALIAEIYNALRANEDLWAETLLVVLFDEHGGFYDHVVPPAAIPPDHHQEEYTFDRFGVRVPAVLASPWVKNDVLHDTFDHTSLLRYLSDKWQLGPLGARTAKAASFAGAIQGSARKDTPPTIPSVPDGLSRQAPRPRQPLNDHETALVALSHALETMAGEEPGLVAARSRQTVTGPQSQIDVAVDRVEAFLKHAVAEVTKEA